MLNIEILLKNLLINLKLKRFYLRVETPLLEQGVIFDKVETACSQFLACVNVDYFDSYI